jgi:hypothetical protein
MFVDSLRQALATLASERTCRTCAPAEHVFNLPASDKVGYAAGLPEDRRSGGKKERKRQD